MSGIVLSASVRQNLLSLQSTASLLATTQNDLATGNKVNSALDNPTNYFTAQALNNRASDINNLLDGIGNGVQVLQAANTGITSLQSLVASAQSIANQALQTTVGYSTLSNVSTTIAGATASNLLGTTSFTSTVASSNILYDGAAGGTTAAIATTTLGGAWPVPRSAARRLTTPAAPVAISAGTAARRRLRRADHGDRDQVRRWRRHHRQRQDHHLQGRRRPDRVQPSPRFRRCHRQRCHRRRRQLDRLPQRRHHRRRRAERIRSRQRRAERQRSAAVRPPCHRDRPDRLRRSRLRRRSRCTAPPARTSRSPARPTTCSARADHGDRLAAMPRVQAFRATGCRHPRLADPGRLDAECRRPCHHLRGRDGTRHRQCCRPAPAISGNVVTDGNGNSTVYLQGGTIADVLKAIDLATGVQTASNSGGAATVTTATGQTASSISAAGALKISTGTNADLAISGTGNALAALGLAGNTGTGTAFTAARTAGVGGISGKTLTFSSFNGGTAVNVTFGTGTGQVQTLNQLNTALQANNLRPPSMPTAS